MKHLALTLLLLLSMVVPVSADGGSGIFPRSLSVQHQRNAINNVCGLAGGAIFYEDINWSGRWRVLCYTQMDLRNVSWYGTPYHMNDKISSLYVWGASVNWVAICTDIDGGGRCRFYGNATGDLDLRQRNMNDMVSSVRISLRV